MPAHSSAPSAGWLSSPDQLAATAPIPIIPSFDLLYMHPANPLTAVRFAPAVLALAADSKVTAPRPPRADSTPQATIRWGGVTDLG